jgi:hypothetical protein
MTPFEDAAMASMAACLQAAVREDEATRAAWARVQRDDVTAEDVARLETCVREWLEANIDRLTGELGLPVEVLQ